MSNNSAHLNVQSNTSQCAKAGGTAKVQTIFRFALFPFFIDYQRRALV